MICLTIHALELINHGPFRGRHRFEWPRDRFVVHVCPNESGKSTLLDAVAAVVWGITDTERHWSAAEHEPHGAALEFTRTNGQACQRFRVERDFTSHRVVAWELDGKGSKQERFNGTHNPKGHTADNKRWVEKLLGEVWAPVSCDAFRHVAMLTQPLSEARAPLVQELITGTGARTTDQAKEALVERFRSISKSSRDAGLSTANARNDGSLDRLQAETDALRSRLHEADGMLASLNSLREQMARIEDEEQKARRQLQDACASLDVIERYRRLDEEWHRMKAETTRLEKAKQDAEELERNIRHANAELVTIGGGLDRSDSKAARSLQKEWGTYLSRRAQLLTPEALHAQHDELARTYVDVWKWPPNGAEQVETYRIAAEAHQAWQSDVTRLSESYESVRPEPNQRRRLFVSLLVGGVSAAGFGALTALLSSLFWTVPAMLLAGFVAALATSLVYRPTQAGAEHGRLGTELNRARKRLDTARDAMESAGRAVSWACEASVTRLVQLGERRRSLDQSLQKLCDRDAAQARLCAELENTRLPEPLGQLVTACGQESELVTRRLERVQELLVERERERTGLTTLLRTAGCDSLDLLASALQDQSDRRATLRRELDELMQSSALLQELAALDGAARDARRRAFEERRAQAEQSAEQNRAEAERLRRKLHRAEDKTELNVAAAEQELKQNEAEIARLEERKNALAEAYRLLSEAAARYSAHHREAIEQRINQLMRAWTDDSSRLFRVASDFSLGLALTSTNGPPVQPPLAALSQGARDQLALAVRIAVLERVGGEIVFPILMDDPLLSWDAARRERLHAALLADVGEHQVVLVSHDSAFTSWGKPVVCFPPTNSSTTKHEAAMTEECIKSD